MAEARRLIEQGGGKGGWRALSQSDAEVELRVDQKMIIQVGKRRHICAEGIRFEIRSTNLALTSNDFQPVSCNFVDHCAFAKL